MGKMLVVRWRGISRNNGIWFDSNVVMVNGRCGVDIEMKGNGNDVRGFEWMRGKKFVRWFEDQLGDMWDKIIGDGGIGEVIKLGVNRVGDYGWIGGDIEEGGDVEGENGDVGMNGLCG